MSDVVEAPIATTRGPLPLARRLSDTAFPCASRPDLFHWSTGVARRKAMSLKRRRALVTVVSLATGWLALGCSDTLSTGERGAVGTSAQSPAPIAIQTSSLFVTVENHANQPLLNVKVALKPPSGTLFATTITRLETNEKRDLSISDFRSPDGTWFNLRMMRPKQVLVTANDLVDKKYEVTVPWQQ
jgi:hypothetical protein